MLDSDIPPKLPIRWAESAAAAYKRLIPTASQIGVTDGAASLTDGFVPLNATPIGAGGIPPDIRDMNGILFQISGWARWVAAGGSVVFDGAFASAIGGYPKGAILRSSVTTTLFWVNTTNGNTTDPDGGSPANWLPLVPVAASNGEVTAGVITTKYVSPAGLAALRASGADLAAGSDNAKYVTPGALATLRASIGELLSGSDAAKYATPAAIAGLRASRAEARNLSNNAKYLTPDSAVPLAVLQSYSIFTSPFDGNTSFVYDFYFADIGVTVKMGQVTGNFGEGGYVFNFTSAFPLSCDFVTLTPARNNSDTFAGAGDAWVQWWRGATDRLACGVVVQCSQSGNTLHGWSYIAVGR